MPPGSADIFKVLIAGIPVALFIHAGAALFIWVFLKAVGGEVRFYDRLFPYWCRRHFPVVSGPLCRGLSGRHYRAASGAGRNCFVFLCLGRERKGHPGGIQAVGPAHGPGHFSNSDLYQLFFISVGLTGQIYFFFLRLAFFFRRFFSQSSLA